jgi:hypothetical protein
MAEVIGRQRERSGGNGVSENKKKAKNKKTYYALRHPPINDYKSAADSNID